MSFENYFRRNNKCSMCSLKIILDILGQSYNANDIINADIENTIHPKFLKFRMGVKTNISLT